MRILRHSDADFSTQISDLQRFAEADPVVQATVAEILQGVRTQGDRALLDYNERFGGPRLKPSELRVTEQGNSPAATRDAIAIARANVLFSGWGFMCLGERLRSSRQR